jgi:transcription elongation GreA/GreB family factor
VTIAFPSESADYRAARDRLLEQEIELRRATEAAETDLRQASSERKVHAEMRSIYGNQSVTIVVPTSGADSPRSFVLAAIGDIERG